LEAGAFPGTDASVELDRFQGDAHYQPPGLRSEITNMICGVVGDTGFEPVTSTVCKRHKKKKKQK